MNGIPIFMSFMTLIDSNDLDVFQLFKMMYRQVQQQPVEVNVNGIPRPEPGSAVVTQEMGPQVF